MDVGKISKVTIEEIEGANYNPLKSIAPNQLKINFPERQLTLEQQLIYNNVMRFVETNLFHALESGFYIEDGKERLRIELRLSADTPDDIDFRYQVEAVLP